MADGGALVEVRTFAEHEVAKCMGLTPLNLLAEKLGVHRSIMQDRTLGRDTLEGIGVCNLGAAKRGRHALRVLPKENADAILSLHEAGFNAVDACRIVARRREILSAIEGLEE